MVKIIRNIVLFLAVIMTLFNCRTVDEKYSSFSSFGIEEEQHRIGSKPIEITSSITNKTIQGQVVASRYFFIFPTGEGYGKNFLRRLAAAPVALIGTVLGIIPFVGEYAKNGSDIVAGAIAGDKDMVELARTMAINNAEADGILVTGVKVEVNRFFIGKTTTVTVKGRPVVYKNLGAVSDERLKKITDRVLDLKLTRMKMSN